MLEIFPLTEKGDCYLFHQNQRWYLLIRKIQPNTKKGSLPFVALFGLDFDRLKSDVRLDVAF